MKKLLQFSFLICVISINPVNAQVGKLLKNVKKSVTNEILGTSAKSTGSNTGSSSSTIAGSNNKVSNTPVQPEPSCNCDPAVLIMEMGKFQIDYTELSIHVSDDGRVLVKDFGKNNYYIVTKGITEAPYKTGDPKIAGFQSVEKNVNDIEPKDYPVIYSNYITRSGEKLVITFNGKKYGPYSEISRFVVSKTKDKFAAIVTENIIMTTEFRNKYEEMGKNAKTDDQKMQLGMKMSEEYNQRVAKYGQQSEGPIYVTNIPGASFNKDLIYVERFFNNIKYGDIVTESGTKYFDAQGKTLATVDCSPENVFISSDNRKSACFSEGELTFSDNKKLSELFNPSLVKEDGKVYLAYMYFSPGKNAIMQCKIAF